MSLTRFQLFISDFEGGFRFWVLGIRSSFSQYPKTERCSSKWASKNEKHIFVRGRTNTELLLLADLSLVGPFYGSVTFLNYSDLKTLQGHLCSHTRGTILFDITVLFCILCIACTIQLYSVGNTHTIEYSTVQYSINQERDTTTLYSFRTYGTLKQQIRVFPFKLLGITFQSNHRFNEQEASKCSANMASQERQIALFRKISNIPGHHLHTFLPKTQKSSVRFRVPSSQLQRISDPAL